jgi:hypothetical protein
MTLQRIAAWWGEIETVAERLIEPLVALVANSEEHRQIRLEEWGSFPETRNQ